MEILAEMRGCEKEIIKKKIIYNGEKRERNVCVSVCLCVSVRQSAGEKKI